VADGEELAGMNDCAAELDDTLQSHRQVADAKIRQ
jgi:hypothetical protein